MPAARRRRQPELLAALRQLRSERSSPARFAERQSAGQWRSAPHLEVLSSTLSRAVCVGGARIIVSMPPRHGKSELVSRYTPVWALDRNPRSSVVICSYNATFAARWGRRCRQLASAPVEPLRFALSRDSRAAEEWETTEGGGLKTAGIGGELTGRGYHLGIIDDPVKNAAEAWSQTIRDAHWDWYQSTFYTRAEPGASIVLVMTRWHEDDLAGRILAEASEPWEEIRLPAIAEEGDQLGRQPGEPLWPWRYDLEALERIRAAVGEWVWHALYQGRPQPGSGAIWRREWLKSWAPHPEREGVLVADGVPAVGLQDCRRYLTVDLAMTEKQTSDWTVVAVWAQRGRHLYLIDLLRRRMEAPEILREIERLYRAHGCAFASVEAVQGQLYICQLLRERGLAIREHKPDRDKRARYMAASPKWERGEVFFPASAPWREALDAELLSVPAARYDDQADACALAELVAATGGTMDPRSLAPPPRSGPTAPSLGIARPLGMR